MNDVKHIYYCSLGFGQQSTSFAFMVLNKHQNVIDLYGQDVVDKIKFIFSDTGEEMPGTYDYILNVFIPYLKERNEIHRLVMLLPKNSLLIKRIKENDMKIIITDYKKLYDHFFDLNHVPLGWVNPKCSSTFKKNRIYDYYRNTYGRTLKNGKKQLHYKQIKIHEFMGIGYEEFQRIKQDNNKYSIREYPLVEMKMVRKDCVNIFKKYGVPVPPKSGCWLCPNKSWKYFKNMIRNDKPSFTKLIVLEDNVKIKGKRKKITKKSKMTLKPEMSMKEYKKRFYDVKITGLIMEGYSDAEVQKILDEESENDDICDSGYCFT